MQVYTPIVIKYDTSWVSTILKKCINSNSVLSHLGQLQSCLHFLSEYNSTFTAPAQVLCPASGMPTVRGIYFPSVPPLRLLILPPQPETHCFLIWSNETYVPPTRVLQVRDVFLLFVPPGDTKHGGKCMLNEQI